MPRKIPNPDFDLSPAEIHAAQARLAASPQTLLRPVIVLAGWRSPHFTPAVLAAELARLTSQNPSDFLTISYVFRGSTPSAVRKVRRTVAQRFATAANSSPPVDVVAISMGGLVARAAALEDGSPEPRLNIARLFTLATPHQGASLARFFRPDAAASFMRPGSAALAALDRDLPQRRYELFCYAQLRDWWVGTASHAPAGHAPYWTDAAGPVGRLLSHFTVNRNPLFALDIALRLRGQPPLARRASQPPVA